MSQNKVSKKELLLHLEQFMEENKPDYIYYSELIRKSKCKYFTQQFVDTISRLMQKNYLDKMKVPVEYKTY